PDQSQENTLGHVRVLLAVLHGQKADRGIADAMPVPWQNLPDSDTAPGASSPMPQPKRSGLPQPVALCAGGMSRAPAGSRPSWPAGPPPWPVQLPVETRSVGEVRRHIPGTRANLLVGAGRARSENGRYLGYARASGPSRG